MECGEKNNKLITQFRRTWCHPILCELDEELSLNVNYTPDPLTSHLKNYIPPPPSTRSPTITQQIEEIAKNSNLKLWKDICKGY